MLDGNGWHSVGALMELRGSDARYRNDFLASRAFDDHFAFRSA